MIELLLKHLYGFSFEDNLPLLGDFTLLNVVQAYGSGKKYCAKALVGFARRYWIQLFCDSPAENWARLGSAQTPLHTNLKPEDVVLVSVCAFLLALRNAKDDVDVSVLEDYLRDRLKGVLSKCDSSSRRVVLQANPGFAARLAVDSKSGSADGLYDARCPACHGQWTWSCIKSPHVPCPICWKGHPWERYRMEAWVINGETCLKH